jgi:hypothetical protein
MVSRRIHLYCGSQFYWWRKPEDPEKITSLSQVIDKLYEIQPTSTNNILMEICDCFFYCLFISVLSFVNQLLLCGGRRGRDHMVVGFTITCVLSAYEGQTTQWTKDKGHKDKQRSTKHYTENYRSSNTNLSKNWVLNAYYHLCFLNLNPAHDDTTLSDKFCLCHK